MNSEQSHEESRSNDGLMIILLLMLVLLALGAGGFFFFMTASKVVEHRETGPVPVTSSLSAIPPQADKAQDNSPFADEETKNTQPKTAEAPPSSKPTTNEQWIEAAQQAVAKKLNLTDNVAWGDTELTKADDGTVVVSGVLTSDGMSRKFSCKLRAEQVAGKSELRASEVNAE